MPTFRDILHQAVDGSFAIDNKQRIIYWDSGCEELLGHSSHWALGRPCSSVLNGCKPGTNDQFCSAECPVAGLADGNTGPKTFPLQVNDRNGDSIALTVTIALVPSACKNSWHVMHLLHKGIYADVLSAMDHANKANTNSSFVHRMSSKKCGTAEEPVSRLTPREMQVLALLSEGNSGAVIAERLCISNTTVRNHIQHIQGKLNIHSQTETVAYTYRHNYL